MSDVPLKEHIEAQIKWLDRYFDAQIEAIHESTSKAAAQIDKRLEGMNEFRDTLRDQAGTFVTQKDLTALGASVDARLKLLELRDARIAGMAAVVAVVVSTVIAFLARLL